MYKKKVNSVNLIDGTNCQFLLFFGTKGILKLIFLGFQKKFDKTEY